MTELFAASIGGDDLDPGYVNIRARAHPAERSIAQTLEDMWARYEPYADPGFVEAFARDLDGRFWELALGCALLEAGKRLRPTVERARSGGQPDLCVLEGDRRIWIEAIAPTRGDAGTDQIPELVPINEGGRLRPHPTRQIHLRITSALWTKTQALERYLARRVIQGTDVRLVAVGASRFGYLATESAIPLALSAVFPIGNEYVRVDRNTFEVVDQGFHFSDAIEREGGAIPRTGFMDSRFRNVSGLLWSRISIGNMSRVSRPLSLIHNPLASSPMPQRWGVWDREFVTTRSDDEWVTRDILDEAGD